MDPKKQVLTILSRSPLFVGLSKEEFSYVASIAKCKELGPEELLFEEGSKEEGFYLIVEGEIEILKKGKHRISLLKEGDVVGEMAVLTGEPRSATARSVGPSKLFYIPLQNTPSTSPEKEVIYHLLKNFSHILSHRLRKSGEATTETLESELLVAKLRLETGRFLFLIIVILSMWVFAFGFLQKFSTSFATYVTLGVSVSVFVFVMRMIKTSLYPATYYGFTFQNWKKNIGETVLFTLPFLLLFVGIKWLMVSYFHLADSVFHSKQISPNSGSSAWLQANAIYFYVLVLVPMQEVIARGGLQTCIRTFLLTKRSGFWAVVLSSLVFSAFHMYISLYFSVGAFLLGLYLGWLFERQKSLVGPIVGHALVGWFILHALAFDKFLRFQGI